MKQFLNIITFPFRITIMAIEYFLLMMEKEELNIDSDLQCERYNNNCYDGCKYASCNGCIAAERLNEINKRLDILQSKKI